MSAPAMYPMDSDYQHEPYDTFAELREHAEQASNRLNFPISWTLYDESDEDWGKYLEPGEQDTREFHLTFLMPRKYGKTWAVTTKNFDPAEVREWLDTFIKGEVMKWYGWQA